MTHRTNPAPYGPQTLGEARDVMRAEIAEKYAGKDGKPGLSIRRIAEETGRSYGFVYRLLEEAIKEDLLPGLRSRGGDTKSKRAVASE